MMITADRVSDFPSIITIRRTTLPGSRVITIRTTMIGIGDGGDHSIIMIGVIIQIRIGIRDMCGIRTMIHIIIRILTTIHRQCMAIHRRQIPDE